MLQLNVNLPELRELAKKIPEMGSAALLDLMKIDIKSKASDFINELMNYELELFIGREKYERHQGLQVTHRHLRNGHYQRTFSIKGFGKLNLRIPRDRKGYFKTKALEPYKRNEANLEEDLVV